METELFIATGVYPVELLASQVSMVCAANWPIALFIHSIYYWLESMTSSVYFICIFDKFFKLELRLCCSITRSPEANSFHLQATRKTYLVTRPGDTFFEIKLRDEKQSQKFVFPCLMMMMMMFKSICEVKACRLSIAQFQCLCLTLACSDMDSSFLVYFE